MKLFVEEYTRQNQVFDEGSAVKQHDVKDNFLRPQKTLLVYKKDWLKALHFKSSEIQSRAQTLVSLCKLLLYLSSSL